ncbi:unnamed protein product, partial [Discosporangium mesarthrocarpum]
KACAVDATAAASTTAVRRNFAQFLYELELQRATGRHKAVVRLRRLVASLLFWLPRTGCEDGSKGVEGRGGKAGPWKLPRELGGHEKTALAQFQVMFGFAQHQGSFIIFSDTLEVRTSNTADGSINPGYDNNITPAKATGESHGDNKATRRQGWTNIEECLWLRVFGCIERYVKPRREEPVGQAMTSVDLIPLHEAIQTINRVFGPSG